ncbi:hypothetical protein B0A48_01368 [Cryoendolithus antarcticus]|uniref:GH16 domain-containing protein n=1 Tax=Cryoendolithus antarcticus TaxID=1507870 RepID=A0A1V8TT27_9PEZI|nr:hypothetical protein B0A48_01368 [Cryoendolithus antarcticus]
MTARRIVSIFALALTLAMCADAACECGFSLQTSNSTATFFTHSIETDFLHISSVAYSGIEGTPWQPQVWNQTAAQSRGAYGRSNLLENIVPNPLPGGTWSGPGARGGDPGLQLVVRKDLVDGMVTGAELATSRTDILYGTFRVGMKVTGINGTCSAFFWYRNDTQEIDVEYLSKNTSIVNTILQSGAAAAQGFDAAGTSTYQKYDAGLSLSDEYHEYRYDWLPDRVDFYLDGLKISTYTENVPDAPGHLLLSHWSNGNVGWSMGPPAEDAVSTISYVKAYFNVSGGDEVDVCSSGTAVCQIPEQSGQPDLDGKPTFFFNPPPPQANSSTGMTIPTHASGAPQTWLTIFSRFAWMVVSLLLSIS